MTETWELRQGKVLVVEDAESAALVVVARDLESKGEKAAVLREIVQRLESQE